MWPSRNKALGRFRKYGRMPSEARDPCDVVPSLGVLYLQQRGAIICQQCHPIIRFTHCHLVDLPTYPASRTRVSVLLPALRALAFRLSVFNELVINVTGYMAHPPVFIAGEPIVPFNCENVTTYRHIRWHSMPALHIPGSQQSSVELRMARFQCTR